MLISNMIWPRKYRFDMKDRLDTGTSKLVEWAITLARTRGIYCAARYLYWCDVPFEVAVRVLNRPPSQRRYQYLRF
jgi:hypothetical protein